MYLCTAALSNAADPTDSIACMAAGGGGGGGTVPTHCGYFFGLFHCLFARMQP